jgi:hypothetical protein
MRPTARTPDAEEMSSLVHRQREQPADLVDQRAFALAGEWRRRPHPGPLPVGEGGFRSALSFAHFLLIERPLEDLEHGTIAVASRRFSARDFLHQTEAERRDQAVQFRR